MADFAPPSGILADIVARKRIDVAARLDGIGLATLRARAAPTRLSLASALARPGARFILELKRASPSKGDLRSNADPLAIAGAWSGVADAMSVLTDSPFFGGSLDDLRSVRRGFAGPILAKDFILDRRQVPEARACGADAVLAILALLPDEEAAAIMTEARLLGMDVLVEAHDEAEVRRAVGLGARLIGINNRRLSDMHVDLATTERLAPLVPPGRLVVAESGIGGRADVERLGPHADAFLVGSSLMRSPHPALAARAMVFGRVKICGITSAADAAEAARSGASFIGLVMVPGTPRAVTAARAEEIASASPIPAVGIFRNEKVMQVASTARALGLHAVQLHGEEDGAYIRGLRALLPEETEIWAAAAVGRELPEPRAGAHRTLFDTSIGGRCGGTGIPFDWRRVRGRSDLPGGILAGGLCPPNAAAAGQVGAYALDVGSGVEAEPGRKDVRKLRAFFEALRPIARGAVPC
ncbi:MAG TPA: bifunctional indole-3-glycerol-phosphate synthase TrpC/phosphoribosylanthranilate isomerase TrpF [Allosphingosinicella sp.]